MRKPLPMDEQKKSVIWRRNSTGGPHLKWGDYQPTFADAILDRLVHNAYRVQLDGQSMRKTQIKTGDESTKN